MQLPNQKYKTKLILIGIIVLIWILNALTFTIFKSAFFTGSFAFKNFSNQYLKEGKAKKILVVGSSPTLAALNTKLLPEAIALGGFKTNSYEILKLLKDILKNGKKPDLLILGLSHHEHLVLGQKAKDQMLGRQISLKEYWEYYRDFSKESPERIKLKVGNFQLHLLSTALFSPTEYVPLWRRFNHDMINLDQFLNDSLIENRGQFIVHDYFNLRSRDYQTQDFAKDLLFPDIIKPDINLDFYSAILKEIFQLVNTHKLKTIVLFPPLPPTSRSQVGLEFISKMDAIVQSLVPHFPTIKFKATIMDMEKTLFYDSIHLNWMGSLIFTTEMLKQINPELNGYEQWQRPKHTELLDIENKNLKLDRLYCLKKQFELEGDCNSSLIIDQRGKIALRVSDKFKAMNVKSMTGEYEEIYPYASKISHLLLLDGGTFISRYGGKNKSGTYNVKDENLCFDNQCYQLKENKDHILLIDSEQKIGRILKKIKIENRENHDNLNSQK